MTENAQAGRQPIEVVQIDQDFCQNTYGSAPCTASLATGGRKCFNTRATCQDPANFDRGTLTLNFCNNQARIPQDGNYYLPFLSSVKVTPGRINPGGGKGSVSALGFRSVISVTFTDHPHNDRIVDPYVDERSYDPFEQGTFWTKWRARNPFYNDRQIRYISGYLDDDGQIVDSVTRSYFLTDFSGPTPVGQVQVRGKDVLSKAQDRKAKAPFASTGSLLGALSSGSTSATLTPSGIGDSEYPASGWVRIGDEVAAFTRASDVLTLTRGQFNTTAADHDSGDTVQLCLRYDSESPVDILYDLLTTYAGIDAAFLDKTGWDAEAAAYLPRLYSAIITEPTGVAELVSEMTDQMYFYIWWDERNDLVKLRSIRPADEDDIYQLTDSRHLIRDSVTARDLSDQRLTQVWVYHALRDPTKDLDEAQNYGALEVIANDKGSADQYGAEAVKVIYSRWITAANGAAAIDLGNNVLARYGNTPREVSFSLDAKDRDVWVGSFAALTTRQIVDDTGTKVPLNVQVIEANEQSVGTTYTYRGQEFVYEEGPQDDELLVVISSNLQDVNLRDVFDSTIGAEPSGDIRFIIRSNVIIGASSTGNAALTVGDWPSGVSLFLDIEAGAFVVGKGGAGGRGGGYNGVPPISPQDAEDGADGGTALETGTAISINNLGVIGGGGGGGGGSGVNFSSAFSLYLLGNGGGGGAGDDVGAGGADGPGGVPDVAQNGRDGNDGGLEFGGNGATRQFHPRAGDGGDLGQDGTAGNSGNTGIAPGVGGSAGDAVVGESWITWDNAGDIRGTRTG